MFIPGGGLSVDLLMWSSHWNGNCRLLKLRHPPRLVGREAGTDQDRLWHGGRANWRCKGRGMLMNFPSNPMEIVKNFQFNPIEIPFKKIPWFPTFSYSHDIIDIGLLISGREPALASWIHSAPEHRETYCHRTGWWENLQESSIFDGKNHGFRLRFSQQNQSIDIGSPQNWTRAPWCLRLIHLCICSDDSDFRQGLIQQSAAVGPLGP